MNLAIVPIVLLFFLYGLALDDLRSRVSRLESELKKLKEANHNLRYGAGK